MLVQALGCGRLLAGPARVTRLTGLTALTRHISVSSRRYEAVPAVPPPVKPQPAETEPVPKYLDRKAHDSYGFSPDPAEDKFFTHIVFFLSVSVCIIFTGFVWAYAPDPSMMDWASREGFIQLRYREAHGLPAVDPNYVDPSTVTLPSDEELGDTEIII